MLYTHALVPLLIVGIQENQYNVKYTLVPLLTVGIQENQYNVIYTLVPLLIVGIQENEYNVKPTEERTGESYVDTEGLRVCVCVCELCVKVN